MSTRNLPDSDAARHGTGDADLTIMLAAHAAFRRDLTRLARAAGSVGSVGVAGTSRHAALLAGWATFKRQLHLHHSAEDTIVWPALRERLSHSEHAQSVLDEMEAEHSQIDPLLAAVDGAFAEPDGAGIAGATDALTISLTRHLVHEEADGLPLIGVALTEAEWRGVGFKIARRSGLSDAGEMFAWMADGGEPRQEAAVLATLPPPARLAYRAIFRPRYRRTARW